MEKSKDQIQKEVEQVFEENNRCTVAGSMGVGKTRMGVEDMDRHYSDYLRVLVAGPKISTFKTWLDELTEVQKNYLLPHIKYTTYASLHKQSSNYDIVYLDEIHNLTEKHIPWLAGFKGKIRGFTGSMPRARSKKAKMISTFAPVKYVYSTDEAVEDKILNDYRIVVHMLDLDARKTLKVKAKTGEFYTSELSSYMWWTSKLDDAATSSEEQKLRLMRMKALMSFPSKENYAKILQTRIRNKCLVFANSKVQADRVCTHAHYSGNKDNDINLALFKEGRIRRLSCIHQLSESINIPELREAIIMHSYSSSSKAPQKLGRLLRLAVDETGILHILCYKGTIDEDWVKMAISPYDPDKIIWQDAVW